MTKTINKFNSLAQIKFVEDIDQEAAANHSGGQGRINDGKNDPDITLFEDILFGRSSIGINAAIGDGIPYVGNSFNDKTSSVIVRKGIWVIYADADYKGTSFIVQPGQVFPTLSNIGFNDKTSSLKRIG